MARLLTRTIAMLCVLFAYSIVHGQKAPSVPEHPWDSSSAKQQLPPPPVLPSSVTIDPAKTYTLAELVNIAEQNNPETRVAWQNAKAKAAELGVSKAALYPTVAAQVLASSIQADLFFGTSFQKQTFETISPTFSVDYTIFDFGARSETISASKSKLLAANFQFNDAHRKIIFQVMQAYYRFLDTKGKEDAARANLKDAQAVHQAAEARFQSGMTTLPDVLEARSAAAQADYDLQAAIGTTEIAH